VPVPVAVTLNAAVCPMEAVWLTGWVEIVGGTLTVSVATLLVTLLTLLVTVTVNLAVLSEAVVTGVV
jgi:hypothetical protein